MEKKSKLHIGWLVTAMVVVLLIIDQWIKLYIKTHFCLGESVRVTDWFFIDFIENNGMAWGMSFIGKFWLSLVRSVAIIFLVWYLHRIIKQGKHRLVYIFLVALVLAGAIGNMIDSMFYGLMFTASSPYYVAYQVPFGEGYAPFFMGKVVDMFRFPFFTYTWPEWFPIWVDSRARSSTLCSILQIHVSVSVSSPCSSSAVRNWKSWERERRNLLISHLLQRKIHQRNLHQGNLLKNLPGNHKIGGIWDEEDLCVFLDIDMPASGRGFL